MYLSTQLLLKNRHKILKFQEKSKMKSISQQPVDPNFKNFPFGVYHGPTPRNHCKETSSLGENSCRQKFLNKSLTLMTKITKKLNIKFKILIGKRRENPMKVTLDNSVTHWLNLFGKFSFGC